MNGAEVRLVRAAYTSLTVTVYQAFSPQIADVAIRAGTFLPPFSLDRMTWIKPSFGWMMHRSGWASKPGQERVLAVEVSRDGFEWALGHSCLSHYDPQVARSPQDWAAAIAESPVRVQWDPDRSITGQRLAPRAIQIGLSGIAARRYVTEWIRSINDITELAHCAGELLRAGRKDQAAALLPAEQVYPLGPVLAARIGADPYPTAAADQPGEAQEAPR